jgi:hypothetical protein
MSKEHQGHTEPGKPPNTVWVTCPQPLQVQKQPQSVGTGRRVDFGIALDATESMGPYIMGVKAALKGGIDVLAGLGLNVQLGIEVYRDQLIGEEPEFYPYGISLEEAKATLDRTQAIDGGDIPESTLPAIKDAMEMPGRRKDAQLVILFVTDAPPHDPERGLTSQNTSTLLKTHKALLFGCCPEIEPYRSLINRTGGILYPIRPDLGPDSFKDIFASLAAHTHKTIAAFADADLAERARKAGRDTIIYS